MQEHPAKEEISDSEDDTPKEIKQKSIEKVYKILPNKALILLNL